MVIEVSRKDKEYEGINSIVKHCAFDDRRMRQRDDIDHIHPYASSTIIFIFFRATSIRRFMTMTNMTKVKIIGAAIPLFVIIGVGYFVWPSASGSSTKNSPVILSRYGDSVEAVRGRSGLRSILATSRSCWIALIGESIGAIRRARSPGCMRLREKKRSTSRKIPLIW